MIMEFEGQVLTPDYRSKMKMYEQKIRERDEHIKALMAGVTALQTQVHELETKNYDLKEELKLTKDRFRNFRAKVKAPE